MKFKIKQNIGEMLLIVGTFFLIFNILSFDSTRSCGLSLNIGGSKCDNPVEYFYSNDVRFMASFSSIVLLAGILIIKRKDKNQK